MSWDCVCGAREITGPYCAWCGRWAPGAAPPPPPLRPPPGPAWPAPQAFQPWGQPQPWPSPPPPGTRHDPRHDARTVVVAGCLATVVWVTTLGGLLSLGGRLDTWRMERRRTHSAAFNAMVRQLEGFVARAKGRPFRDPVVIETLPEGAFVDKVLGHSKSDPFSQTLTGLGLAGGQDAHAVRNQVLASHIGGLYSPTDGVLYVRGSDGLDAIARLVMVHELTHAWQDQHYDLEAVGERADNLDAARAIRALIEGDANYVEHRWLDAQPEEVRHEIDLQEYDPDSDSAAGGKFGTVAEQSLSSLLRFSYTAGERFVRAVAASGGADPIGAAFADPPVSTQQVLHPKAFLEGDVPQDVSSPTAPDGVVVLDNNVLGEAGLAVFAAGGRLTPAAMEAVAGWDGDTYLTWRSSDGTVCTEDDVAMESRAARDRLLRYLRQRSLGPGGSVTPIGSLRLHVASCAE